MAARSVTALNGFFEVVDEVFICLVAGLPGGDGYRMLVDAEGGGKRGNSHRCGKIPPLRFALEVRDDRSRIQALSGLLRGDISRIELLVREAVVGSLAAVQRNPSPALTEFI